MERKNKYYYLTWGIIIGFVGGVILKNPAMGMIVGVVVGTLIDDMVSKKIEKDKP